MSAGAIAALVTALDTIADLDACSRDEKIATAKKILERAPACLPADIAQWIRDAGKKLRAKLQREPLTNPRRLAYVGTIASNGPPDLQPDNVRQIGSGKRSAPVEAESDFVKQTLREIAEADAEIARMPQSRHDRVAAIAKWERDRVDPRYHGQVVPTPWWALYGFDSPEEYASRNRPRLRGMSADAPTATAPKVTRGLDTLDDVITESRALNALHVANEEYAEDQDAP